MPNRMSRVFSKLLPAKMAGLVGTSLLSLSLLSAGAGVASAQPAPANKPKNSRNVDVKVDVKLSDRVKPIQKEAPKTAAPELTADKVLSIEGLVGDLRNEQTQILVDLIANTDDREVEEKSDYYYRLGEIYAKQQRFYRLKTAESQIAADMAKKPADKAKFTKAATDNGTKAKAALVNAVKVYRALTENDKFKNYAKMDQALFYYGYTLQGGKYMTEARAAYDKLLKNYPNSKYVPEAHLAFADYFFETNDLENAEARYKQVLKFPKSNAFWYAMYKIGWIDLNKQKEGEALEIFQKVAEATKGDPKQEVLNRASKKDYVRAYATAGKTNLAFQAFKRIDDKYAFTMLGLLADLYLEQGKNDKAIVTYQEMIKNEPKDKNVCLWQYNITRAMLTAGDNDQKIREIETLVKMYGALKGKKILPAAEAEECRDNAAAMSGELARAYHSESSKTRNPQTLAYAEKLYKVYLDVFPDASDFAQTQYYYAELMWARAENEKTARLQTELWENAAVAFTDVVKLGKVDDKTRKESAYATVQAWKNALNVDPRLKKPTDVAAIDDKADKVPPPAEIPPREQKMLAAFDVYITYIKDPKDDDLVGMKFHKANTYRKYYHYAEATPIFLEILEKHRTHETAEYSANLLLDTYNRTQQYDELAALADKLADDKKFLEGKDDLKVRLDQIKVVSMRKISEKLEKEAKASGDFGKYVLCGQSYLNIYNRNPEAEGADEVLYNAGVCFEEGKSIGASITAYNLLQKYFPNSKQTARAIARLGNAYGEIAFYRQASEKLEEYSKKYGSEKDAFDAMSDAVFYRKGIGDDAKAIEDTNSFVAQYKTKRVTEAANARFSLTSVYEKQGDKDQVITHLRKYLGEFGDKGGGDKVVQAYTKIGLNLWEQSCPVKTVDNSCVKIERERAVRQQKRRKSSEQPTQCGDSSKIKMTVVARDEKKVKEAMASFAKAISEFEKRQGKMGDGEAAATYFYAQAKFHLAEKDYETYLAMKFPTGLNFDPKNKALADKSMKRFTEWFETKAKAGSSAREKYEGVIGVKEAANAIASAARLGQVQQNFSDQLFTAEIPTDVRTGEFADEKVEAYCDALTSKADPLEAASLNLFGACLRKSTELGWFSDWSKLCERELGQIKPEEFPSAFELRDNPDQVAPVTATEAPIKLD